MYVPRHAPIYMQKQNQAKSVTKVRKSAGRSPVVQVTPRKINDFTRLELFVRAGGRCQFDGCNLMLLCPQCHKLIDNDPDRHSVATLEKYKEKHEERIHHVTRLGPDLRTTVVQLKARIADQSVAIPAAQVTEAVAPRYPMDTKGHVIDLTAILGEGKAFLDAAVTT